VRALKNRSITLPEATLPTRISHRHGFLLQLIAAGWHFKSEASIARLAAEVGPVRIMVIHGTNDNMITFPHGEELLEALGGEEAGITKRFLEGQGHVIPIEMRKEFKRWIEELVEKTEALKEEKTAKSASSMNGANGHALNGHSSPIGNGHAK
jgi:hypothetical protein